MKKLLILLFVPFLIAAAPIRENLYVPGAIIDADDVMANEDAIFNYLEAGIDTYAVESILNADINTSANIQSAKLNLSAISQAVVSTGLVAQTTIQIPYGATRPSTCATGSLYFDIDADTDGSVYVCTSAGVWKEIDDD